MSRRLPSSTNSSVDEQEPRVVGLATDEASALLSALSSETARDMLSTLHREPATTSELAASLNTSLQNVQYHLENLTEAGAVEVVDTVYSTKGCEMDVYAPADDPLVLFAGRQTSESDVTSALTRLLGGYGIAGLVGVAAQSTLSAISSPGESDAEAGTIVGTETTASPSSPAGEPPSSGPALFDVQSDMTAFDQFVTVADHAFSALTPGVVVFLAVAALVSVVWAIQYRELVSRSLSKY